MKLRTYLFETGMTIKDFSSLIGCHPSYISTINSGKKMPGRRLAKDIEDFTNGLVKFSSEKEEKTICSNIKTY